MRNCSSTNCFIQTNEWNQQRWNTCCYCKTTQVHYLCLTAFRQTVEWGRRYTGALSPAASPKSPLLIVDSTHAKAGKADSAVTQGTVCTFVHVQFVRLWRPLGKTYPKRLYRWLCQLPGLNCHSSWHLDGGAVGEWRRMDRAHSENGISSEPFGQRELVGHDEALWPQESRTTGLGLGDWWYGC